MQRKHLLFPLLAGLAFLLTACPGPSGNGTGNTDQVTVRLEDPEGKLVAAYYRVGSGTWQQLSFQNNQATFPAQGTVDYEVAARCAPTNGVPDVQFFKASTAKTRQLDLACSRGQPAPSVSFTLRVRAPASIGGVTLREGDIVFASTRGGATGLLQQGSEGLEATLNPNLPSGEQVLGVVILRNEGTEANPSLRPIGGKVVSANVTQGGTLTLDPTGWQALTAKGISASLPAGFLGAGFVAHFRNGMKGVVITGAFDRYGVFPDGRGVYLGMLQATAANEDSSQEILLVKDTRGNDWTAEVPAPWAQDGFTLAGGTLTFRYAGAQGFGATIENLVADRNSGTPLQVGVSVFAQGNTTTYTLPNLGQELGYTLTQDGDERYQVTAILRGMTSEGANILFSPTGEPTEALLRGLDLALVHLRRY